MSSLLRLYVLIAAETQPLERTEYTERLNNFKEMSRNLDDAISNARDADNIDLILRRDVSTY